MSRLTRGRMLFYPYGAVTRYGPTFQTVPVLYIRHWPDPRSLATTSGVSVDVLSYGYLDVSVPRVRFLSLCIQDKIPFNDTWKPQQQVALLL